MLTGASAEMVAAGGIRGAEGSVWLVVSGKSSQIYAAEELLKSVAAEPAFAF
jgi:6-phosphogluconate dehydrogenase (decarboxylating)